MTVRTGIQPGVCIVRTPPQRLFEPTTGDVRFTCGATGVVFRNCMVESATLEIDRGQLWSVRILDRRWKWRYGHISGAYNIRQRNGRIRDGSERSLPQLAALLLRAMGESQCDTAALRTDLRPAIAWDYSNPARELRKLCDLSGCVITLGLDNRVRLMRAGDGPPLPVLGVERNAAAGVQSSLRPDALTLAGGPTLYQDALELEAVGLDTCDQVKPIDQLSYKPAAGWGGSAYESMADVAAGGARNRALQTVWKWYRVKNREDGRFAISQIEPVLDSYVQILPLRSTLLEADASGRPAPAYVTGEFWSRSHAYTNTAAGTRYNGRFRIDGDQGIVKFSSPVLKLGASQNFAPAVLKLVTTFPARLTPEGGFHRRIYTQQLPGARLNTRAEVVHHAELFHTVDTTSGSAPLDNAADFDRAARLLLTAAAAKYQPRTAAELHYAGIVPAPLSGATVQVTYSTGPQGAFTHAIQRG